MKKTAIVVRWTARVLSLPIVLVWAAFAIGYAIGPERSLPSDLKGSIAYVTMIVSFLALATCWRWEFVGSIVALVAVAIGAAINWRGFLSLNFVVPINAAVFLLSWWLNRSPRQE